MHLIFFLLAFQVWDRQTGRQIERHTDGRTDRHTDTQTDRKTDRYIVITVWVFSAQKIRIDSEKKQLLEIICHNLFFKYEKQEMNDCWVGRMVAAIYVRTACDMPWFTSFYAVCVIQENDTGEHSCLGELNVE